MCLANNIRYLRKKKNYSQDYIAEKLGYKSYTTIQKWESGVSEPSIAKLRELADLFDVDMNDMTTKDIEKFDRPGEPPDTDNHYYLNDEARELAQFMFENPEYRVLFDASRKVKKEDIEFVKQMIDRMRGDNDDTGC